MQETNKLVNHQIYKFHDFYRNGNGNYIVVAKEEGNSRGVFKLPATELVTSRKDLLSKFLLEDKINIIGLAATEKPPIISIKRANHFRFFPILAMIFGCTLVATNIASSKLIEVFGITLSGGTGSYELTYCLGGVITEVYGFKRARQLIWGAIACNLIVLIFISLSIYLPASPLWPHQDEYAFVLGSVPRIIGASLISYFCGEFLNSYLFAKLKIIHKGKKLWLRIILSSFIAMTVDNFMFLTLSYWGTIPFSHILGLSNKSYLISLLFEWLSIPVVAKISKKLKSAENVDIFDINTKFTPFSLDVNYTE
ncbi:queuosine precursor transporter [Fluoribacter gormanii]|uniref:queuosine precursor transporter n=1 Tax=Fluoribacter gormanii TaxID=464 RepID=UPI00104151AC|nr:queuosine precursor transporter [Fluoribacter gormanii]